MSFAGDLEAFAKKYKVSADTVLRKVTADVGASLAQMSPVDTGRFRANWQLGVGAPNHATTIATQTSEPRLKSQALSVSMGDVVYITNSLPYAQRLEYGWSKQAPQGMVRITAARFNNFIKAAL